MPYVKSGSEFLVNTTTTGDQYDSSAAALSNGGFVVTWTDKSASGGDTNGWAVRGQLYAAGGIPVGGEFLVNTTTVDIQQQPSVAMLNNGGFVVIWTDGSRSGGDTDSHAVRGQMFTADGIRSGGEFLVNTITASSQSSPSVSALSNGGFVVTWTDSSGTSQDSDGTAVLGQLFTVDGTRSGSEFLVNRPDIYDPYSKGSYDQYASSVTALSNGGFVVTWTFAELYMGTTIYGRVFTAGGSPAGNEFAVTPLSSSSKTNPSVTGLRNGGFVVTWSSGGQLFSADGSPVGSEFLVDTPNSPSVSALNDGGFVVTWNRSDASRGDGSEFGVYGQVFAADGTPSGSEFLINTTTASAQYASSVSALSDGGFVVTWTDESASAGDTSGSAVRGQVFTNTSVAETPIYRFFNVDTGFHFYTASLSERNSVMQNLPQFHYEGEAFNAASSPATGTTPVYRFFHTGLGNHFYTASQSERDSIIGNLSHIYSYEGTAYHAFAGGTNSAPAGGLAPVFRFFNYQRGSHFFTASASERDSVIANLSGTFRYEGVACYVPASSTSTASATSAARQEVAAAGERLYEADGTAFFGAVPTLDLGDRLGAGVTGTVFDDGRPVLSSTLQAAAPRLQFSGDDLIDRLAYQDSNTFWR